jgi:hypothetical protein
LSYFHPLFFFEAFDNFIVVVANCPQLARRRRLTLLNITYFHYGQVTGKIIVDKFFCWEIEPKRGELAGNNKAG